VIEIFLLMYIPLGTYLLNKWRMYLSTTATGRSGSYIIVSIITGAAPLIYARSIAPDHSALLVVLAGIALFWFAIVGARSVST
jgi:VIT1/CCC1 family predicted Fe2+/Mn2+ transporter